MKRGLLTLCLVASLCPVTAFAAAPDFAQALTSLLTEGKPQNFNGTVTIKSTDADLKLKVRGAGEVGKLPKSWVAFDVKGKVQGQVIDLSVELRFKNDKTYIRVDDARPDFFFSRWEGVKGKWYVLPAEVTEDDVKTMLPSSLDTSAADLASMLDVVVTRFKTGHSFVFTAPMLDAWNIHLSGKIDSSTDNQYRYATVKFGWSEEDMTISADFKIQRQFVSVYVETPRGTLKPFPAFTAEQHALLNGMGGAGLSEWLWAPESEQPMMKSESTTPVIGGTMMTEPAMTIEPENVQTVTVPQGTVTVRSRSTTQRLPNDRAVLDRAAIRSRYNLNNAHEITAKITLQSTGNEQLLTLADSIVRKIRGADVSAVIKSGTAATMSMKTIYSILKDAELSNAGVTYVYIVAPTKGTDAFTLLVDSYTLLSADLLDLDRNGTVDKDEKPATPGTVYTNALYTKALKSPVVDYANGETTAYVPLRDGAGNILAVLAVTQSVR